MKNLFFIAAAAAILSISCSKLDVAGVSSTKYVNLPGNYTSRVVAGPMTVEVSSAYDMVKVTSDSNVLPYIEIYTEGNDLVIKYEDGVYFSGRYETVIGLPFRQGVNRISLNGSSTYRHLEHVTYQSPVSLDVKGASEMAFGSITAENIFLSLADASAFAANMSAIDYLDVNASGASGIWIDGGIKECHATLEDASILSRLTESKNDALRINDFQCYLYDSSYACLWSNGFVSGALYDSSSLTLSGNADFNSVICDGNSEIVIQ